MSRGKELSPKSGAIVGLIAGLLFMGIGYWGYTYHTSVSGDSEFVTATITDVDCHTTTNRSSSSHSSSKRKSTTCKADFKYTFEGKEYTGNSGGTSSGSWSQGGSLWIYVDRNDPQVYTLFVDLMIFGVFGLMGLLCFLASLYAAKQAFGSKKENRPPVFPNEPF